MNDGEEIELFLSRGLDGDLSREEMRRLYRLAAKSAVVQKQMGELSAMEEGLAELAAVTQYAHPRPGLEGRLRAEASRLRQDGPGWFARFWHWLRSPHGFSLQPISFGSGVVLAMLLLGTATPVFHQFQETAGDSRLMVNEVQFVKAKPRIDWTHRFIVMPGDAVRLAMQSGTDSPVHLQFEASEPADLVVSHDGPGTKRDSAYAFTVNGIGYASLRHPQPGDTVSVRNNGRVPVVVNTHTLDVTGSTVSRADQSAL